MTRILRGFVLPLLLLTEVCYFAAGLLNWSLISFIHLVTSLVLQFNIPKRGYRLRLASCLAVPAVQLVGGISNPSWISLPIFLFSCVGLIEWSLTSNFLGLFSWKT
ncbi:piezo-type mechanosensitive ion channel homolog isoform X1 [Primulina tabacum]|uniref:piezo-type mechanosensitive ion channel homolog isoform X1 n=1 Tax=Primulina tabacum TaxID=48773 RepID=UPI003F5A0AA9